MHCAKTKREAGVGCWRLPLNSLLGSAPPPQKNAACRGCICLVGSQAAKAGQLPQQLRRTQGMFAASGAPVASGQAAYPPPAAHAHAHASRAPAAAAQKSMVIEVTVALATFN